jgi:hypothetical protein
MFNSETDAAALFKTEVERWGARVKAIGMSID